MKLLGTQESASRLGVTTTRVATMIRTGLIKAQKIGRTWVIDEEEVQRVAKQSRPPGRPRKCKGKQ